MGLTILYHGTDSESANAILKNGINLLAGEADQDFGRGFYTTPNLELAYKRALFKSFNVSSKPAVISIGFDEKAAFMDDDLRIKCFPDANVEWAQFVVANRCGYAYIRRFTDIDSNVDSRYDVVKGRIADGDIADVVMSFTNNPRLLCDADRKALTGVLYPIQYSFHTEAALKYIKTIRIQ